MRKACSPKPLGKYKSQELGALSTVCETATIVGRGAGVGKERSWKGGGGRGREGELEREGESDGTRNAPMGRSDQNTGD